MNYVKELEKVIGVTSTTYRSVVINHFENNYWVHDICLTTLEGAKKHIDASFEAFKKSIR